MASLVKRECSTKNTLIDEIDLEFAIFFIGLYRFRPRSRLSEMTPSIGMIERAVDLLVNHVWFDVSALPNSDREVLDVTIRETGFLSLLESAIRFVEDGTTCLAEFDRVSG